MEKYGLKFFFVENHLIDEGPVTRPPSREREFGDVSVLNTIHWEVVSSRTNISRVLSAIQLER
ncbi:hypothetical protein TSIB_1120 [Thermococcus sibiricus MM 739]|uniref:Uncharacterized protein n=1 Tax=Thermococcus sibiricus (strain DSM 12597 / MM 739) TaxID=604354 RepID=C6A3H9_THESM|nr:hypothetical protein TSIB_1120 [Thermococcus sibiricus MM 739]